MKHVELMKHAEDTFHQCLELLKKKGEEYSQDKVIDDRFVNFKRAGAIQDISTKEALTGMMSKQLASIVDMTKRPTDPNQKALWREKVSDSINYLAMLLALVEEESQYEDNLSKVATAVAADAYDYYNKEHIDPKI